MGFRCCCEIRLFFIILQNRALNPAVPYPFILMDKINKSKFISPNTRIALCFKQLAQPVHGNGCVGMDAFGKIISLSHFSNLHI